MLDKLNKKFSKGYENFFKDNNQLANLLFYIAVLLLYIICINNISKAISIDSLIVIKLKVITSTIFILKILFNKENLFKYLLFLILISIAIACDLCTGLSFDILFIVLLIIASRNIDSNKVIKMIICLNIITIGYHCAKYIIDYNLHPLVLKYQAQFIQNGIHSFYFCHPRIFVNILFSSWLMWFYLNFNNKEQIIKVYIIGLLLAIITYIFTGFISTTIFYFIAMILYFVFQNKKLTNKESIKIIVSLTFLLCFFLSWFSLITFGQDNIIGEFISKINEFLNNRVLFGKRYLLEYGASLFGKKFTLVDSILASEFANTALNNWYYYMIIRLGLLMSIFYCFIFCKSLLKLSENNNWSKVFVIVIFLLYSCIECVGVIPIISIPYFFIGMFL